MTDTPEKKKALRHSLDWTSGQMATALGLANGSRVREFEQPIGAKAHKTPAGPTALLYRLIAGEITWAEHIKQIEAMRNPPKKVEKNA